MPRTRPWPEYRVNRLLLSVGIAMASWLPLEGPVPPAERAAYECRLADYLGLVAAVQAGLLTGYAFRWDQDGRLARVRLTLHPGVRQTPGLAALKRYFRL